ncbi:type II toxin-antitoxin system VapC family toxin [Mumia zhuanghuii]|uniref:type II toxin-antitoxin system VapC family toxin n=1 Tax=Mumia zhuanghuii TaxID=2585211 RepID=UPI0036453910
MIVDANVLLYAVDRTSPFHEVAADWLEGALSGTTRIGFPWPTLLAFQRIATHPRASASPRSPAEAWSFVEDWIQAEQAWIPVPGPRHAEVLGRLLVDGDLRANLVPDAHLAALALENGVGVCSFDSDFARFDGLSWHNPSLGR